MVVFGSENPRPESGPSLLPRALVLLKNSRGFSLMELLIAITVFGILAAVSIPMMLSVIQASQTRGAAQELVTILNQARQLAITQNRSIQINFSPAAPSAAAPATALRFVWTTAVAGDPPCGCWLGPRTDGNGYITLANETRIVYVGVNPLGANPAFNSLGAATTPGIIRVQNLRGTSCLEVAVSASGRIKTQTATACP